MKLHLPVRLFRAIIALMVFVPMTSSPSICAEEEPVRVYVNQISDLDDAISGNYLYILNSNIEGSLYYIQKTSNVVITSALSDSSPSYYVSLEGNNYDSSLPRFSVADFSFDNLASLTFSNFRTKPKEVNISDSGLTSSSAKGSQESYGAIQVNKFAIKDIEDNVTFQGNVASSYVKASAETTSYGYMTWSATARAEALTQGGSVCAISCIDIVGNSADISFSENIATAYSYTSAVCSWLWTGAKSYATSLAQAKGGALCGPVINIAGNKGTITLNNNKAEAEAITHSYSYGSATNESNVKVYGGALYGSEIKIHANEGTISFLNNKAIAKGGSSATGLTTETIIDKAESYGGAIYATTLSIQNNGDVIFEGNSADGVSDALYAEQLILSAAEGKKITFYDSFEVKGNVLLNANYNENIEQIGTISLIGKTATVGGNTTVYNGTLQISNSASYKGNIGNFVVQTSKDSSTTVQLQTGDLSSYCIVFQRDTILSLSGLNTIKSSSLEMKDGSIWSFDLSSTHLTSAALTYTGSLTLGGKLTINLASEESLEAGRYTLLTLASETAPTSSWTADNIIINAEEGMSASWDNLYWDDNTLYYLSSAYPVGALVWTGSGDMNWNTATQNWKINEVAALYSNSKDVIFSDLGAGEVTIAANYAPKSVLVENAAGKDYSFIGTGCLSGNMALTKKGEGTLTLATANTYTGGTVIEAGKVVLDHIMGLGTGPVSLTGGTLDFATNAATNIVNASAGMVCGSAFNGTLNVDGDLTLGDNFKANTIVLNTGSLRGGNIIGTKIDAYGGEIRTSISADSHLYAKGKVTVLSVPTFSGISAAIDGAELSFENTGLSYSGNDLSGLLLYSLNSTISIKDCTVNFLNNKGETKSGVILANVSDGKGGHIVFEDNDAILFLNNESRSNANYGSAASGVAYCGAKSSLIFKDNTNVTFQGNRAIQTSTNGSAVAGAVNVFQTSRFELSGNTLVEFDGNYASAGSNGNTKGGAIWCQGEMDVVDNTSVIFKGNYAAAGSGAPGQGGAICAALFSSLGCQLNFVENDSILFENNYALGGGSTTANAGGALMIAGDEPVRFHDNGTITFRGNYVESSTGSAYGGAIYANSDGTVEFANNGHILFEKNYEKTSGGYRLRSLYLTEDARFSTGKDYSVTFNDGIYIGGDLILNKQYISENGEQIAQTGDIVLSGEFAKAYLEEIKNGNATSAEISNSRSSVVEGNIEIYDGRFIIKEGVNLKSGSITVHSSTSGESMPSLVMQNAHIKGESAWASDMNQVLVESHACLAAQGVNTLTYCTITFEDDITLSLQVTPDNVRTPILSFSTSSLNLADDASFTLVLSHNGLLADGYSYMLIEGISQPSDWTSESVTIVSGTSSWSVDYDDLRWEGKTLWLDFNDTSGSTTPPALLIATWTNEAQNGMWNSTSLNWEQEEVDYAYVDGVQVVFGDEGAGPVTLVGDIAPSSVLVDSTKDYTWEADTTESGKLTGDMTLTKKGTGTLTINTENDYTGGTQILGGKVVAGTATALGSGVVSLNNAGLEIKAEDFANVLTTAGVSSIVVKDGSLKLDKVITNAVNGTLTLSGKVDVSGIGQLTKLDATQIDVNGNAGESGFTRAEGYSLQVVQGGKVLGIGAELVHSDLPTGLTLVLGENGLATAGASTNFTKYVVAGSHAVSVSEILKDVPTDRTLSTIEMTGGTLLVDAATDALSATAGTVTVTRDVELGGTMSGGMLLAQAGEIAATLSGSTSVVANGTVSLSGNNSHRGGVMLNGGSLTLQHANALGSGQLVTSGISSLVIDSGVELALGQAISNSGTLSISGNIQAKGNLNTVAATRVDVNGNSGTSGFDKDALEWVQIVNGGTTVNAGAAISHASATGALVLGSDGLATCGGEVHHDTYLLTGTGVADVQAIKDAAGSELTEIYMTGGTLTVGTDTEGLLNAKDGVIMLGSGGVIGSGSSVNGVDIKASGGSIAAILNGSNTLEGIGNFALDAVIANNSTLVLSGSIKADALDLVTESPAALIDVDGASGTSGFARSALMSVQLTSGTGSTIDGGVTLTHKDATDTLVLGSDGKASYGGTVDYTHYLLNGINDKASVSGIIADAGDALNGITVQAGTLTVDAVTKPVTATGGAVVLDGGVLNGSLEDTALTLKNGSLGAASITGGSVSGENYLMGAVLNVSGDVAVSGSFNASALQLNTTNATRIDVNGASGASGFYQADAYSVQVFNGGVLTVADGTTVTHGSHNLVLGSDGVATAGGGITWSEYLLTGDDTATASAIYDKALAAGYNGAVAITQTGGTLNVTDNAAVCTTAGNIILINGTLSGTISGATLSVSGGMLAATLSGTNTLSGANKLLNVLDNEGLLNISGSLDVTQLGGLTDHGVTYTKGGSNGFKTSSAYSIRLVENGGTLNSTATIKHGEIDNFVLGQDGVATAAGTTDYKTYFITAGHEATVDAIRGESGNQLTLVDMSGGTLNANADAAVKVTGGAINLTAGTLSGSISGAALSITGGSLTATLSGPNTLSGANKLLNVLDNEGTLNISGTLDVTQLGGLTDHGVTYTKGGSNGFKTSSAYSIRLVENGGTLNSTATIKHGEIDNFVLGSDGVATAAGTTDYKTYFITAGHEATVDAIRGESGNQLTLVDMSGGILNANADAAVKVMGGEVKLTAGELSGSISGATLSITGGALTAALSGTNTLSGANKLYNVLDNDGVLNINGSLDVTQLGALTDHGETYTKGGSNGFKTSSAYSIKLVDNSGSLNSTATIKHGEIDNFVLGSDGVATAAGTTDYKTYYITSGHAAAVDAIRGESGNQLTLIDMSGGILNANADAAVKVMGGEVKLTAGELSGSISGATLSVSGGTLAATLSGNNTLSGANKLYNVLDNDGVLNINGTLDVTQLGALTDHGETYTKGGSNGFKTSSAYSIKLVDNGGTLNSTATIKHGEIDNFVLGSDGVATAAGTTNYKTYYITSGHAAAVDAIRGESGNQLTLIDMSGGTLNANADAAVKVMGGEVKLTAGELSGSISGATLSITGGSLTATLSGTNTLSGANKLLNVLDNDGLLNISGSLDVTQLGNLTDHGVTYTKGGSNGFKTSSAYSIKLVDNGGTLNSTAAIKHGAIDNFVLGSDGVATAAGTTNYKTYYITSGHDAAVDAIRGESGNQLTLIDMSGGTLNANADAAVKVMGGEVKLTAGELSGSISGATLSITGGSLTATLSGTNTLSGANKLLNVLDNDGLLNISGSLDVTQLGGLTDHGVTYTKGGSNGFKTSSAYSIRLVENSGTLNSTATIKHGEIDNFVLGQDGVATAAGTTDYKTYFITAGHEATVDAIRGESGNQLTLVDMSGGTLNANADAAVKVMGGEVKLTAGELSGSISGATLGITGGLLTASLSGTNTLSGTNKLFNVLNNDGNLNISGSLDVTQLGNLTDHGVTYTKGGSNGFKTSSAYSIRLVDNGGTLNSTATIKHGEIDNFVLDSDGVATAAGTTDYKTYFITAGHEATLDVIRGESGNQLTLVDMSGGTLNANADAAVKVTGGAINLTAGMLSGTISGATLSITGGALTAELSGTNTLSGTNKLFNVLNNDGNLNISGSLDVTQLGGLTDHGVTYTKGGSNGFKTSSAYSIRLVENGGTLNSTATIKHRDIDNFVLGSDGVATAAGTTDYKTYYITSGHAAAVDAIRGESGNQLTLIDMSGGILNANADAAVKVTGGAINLTAGTLSGTISGATLSVSGGTLAATLSGNNTLSGANKLLNVLDNEGTLNISGTLDVTQLGGLTDHGVTYTKGGSNGFKTSSAYSIKLVDNGGTLNSTATIKHGEIDNFVLGSDGVATAAGTTDYKTYFITAGHEATVDVIRGESGNQLTLVDMSGGILNANADAAVKVMGGEVKLTAGELSGSISGATLSVSGGTLAATLSGNNTLSGANKLYNVLDNDGVLNINGTLDVTQLGALTDHGETYTKGGSNGFKTSSAYSIKLVDNSGSLNSTATIKHGEIDNFVLDSDGVARAEGTTFYDTYYITSGHEATVDAIRGESGNQLTLVDMSGGTLNANADAAVKVTGGAINLTAGTLSGSISGSTINASAGTLAATLNGINTLVGDGYVLNRKLTNSGTLTLSGTFTIGTGLTVQHTAAGYESLNGSYDTTNGFARTEWYSVDIADGVTADANATITYDGKTLKLGNDGVATHGGEVDYTMYYLNSGALSTKSLHDQVAGADITLKGGTLTVETQSTVTATGGAIKLVENGVLNGSLTNTNLTLTAGVVNASISGGKVTGNAYALSEVLQVSGDVSISGSFNASALQLVTEGSTRVDVVTGNSGNSGFLKQGDSYVQLINGGVLTIDGVTVSHQDAATPLILGNDGYARSTGGTNYGEYLLTGSDRVSTQQIHFGAGAGASVRQEGGMLTVNDATTVKTTSGEIVLSDATLHGEVSDARVTAEGGCIAATLGGITAVTITGEVSMSGNNSHSGVTTLAAGNLTITHAQALGSGDIVSTGASKLVVDGVTLVLGDTITNTGTLTLSGSIDASALQLNKTEAGRLSLSGERVGLTESGFSQGEEYTVLIVDGGSTVNAGAGISHKDYLSRTQLVLGEDGVARAGAEVDYTHFFLTGGDSAEVSKIAEVAERNQVELDGVNMDSGSLTVDQSITVSATGGSIVLTKAATLGGSIENTAVSSSAGNYSAEISALMSGDSALVVNGGEITVSAANSYTGGTQVNGGALMAGNAKAFGTGDVVVNGSTLDLNRFSITNKVVMNGSSTLGNADGASHIVLGSGAAVNFRNGYTLGSGKRLTVAGPASYTGALTLGGGTLELSGLLTVRGDVEFVNGATTTLDISGWKGLDDGDVMVDFGSSNSGYADGSLSLEGIAGDWELAFDAATGVLTLVAVKDEPMPEPEPEPMPEPEFAPELNRNQLVVYDTVKDIMGEGKPSGLLGQLGKEVTGTRDEARLKELLDALGGAEYATLMSSQQDATRGHMRRLRGSMGSGHALVGTNARAYIEAYTNRADVDGDASGRGYEMTENGGQFVLEFIGEENVSGGLAVASGRTKLQPDGGLSQKGDNTYVDAFLVCREGGYTGKTSLGVGVHSYDLERNVMGNAVSAQTDGSSVNFMHESAYEVAVDEVNSVQFFGAVESSMGKLGAFHEKGADTASLQVESQDAWMTTLSAGARYHYSFAAVDAAPAATLSLQAGVEYKLGDTESEVEVNFSGARRKGFKQSGTKRDTFGYNLGASLHVPVSARAAVYASGDAVLRGDSREVNANVGIQLAF